MEWSDVTICFCEFHIKTFFWMSALGIKVLKGKKFQDDPPTYPGGQVDQVDSEIKDIG